MCAFKQESGMATGGVGEPFMTRGPVGKFASSTGFSMGEYRDIPPTGERGSIRSLESEVILEGFVAAWAMAGAFSTLAIAGISTLAIGKATRSLVDEARSQFQTTQESSAHAEAISGMVAGPAISGAMLPAFYIILLPVSVGLLAGPRALAGFVMGAILSTGPFATVLFNAGASWVKAKTAIEAEGVFFGSGSDSHLASISSARTGGAFKDVTAPTVCSYIKAISIWSLMITPAIYISPMMPWVIQCAVARSGYESVFTCMDWNKAYWAILPGSLLLLITAIIYYGFWNRDGTVPPVAEEPEKKELPAQMTEARITEARMTEVGTYYVYPPEVVIPQPHETIYYASPQPEPFMMLPTHMSHQTVGTREIGVVRSEIRPVGQHPAMSRFPLSPSDMSTPSRRTGLQSDAKTMTVKPSPTMSFSQKDWT
jgi:hypothetical protein